MQYNLQNITKQLYDRYRLNIIEQNLLVHFLLYFLDFIVHSVNSYGLKIEKKSYVILDISCW